MGLKDRSLPIDLSLFGNHQSSVLQKLAAGSRSRLAIDATRRSSKTSQRAFRHIYDPEYGHQLSCIPFTLVNARQPDLRRTLSRTRQCELNIVLFDQCSICNTRSGVFALNRSKHRASLVPDAVYVGHNCVDGRSLAESTATTDP